MFVAGARASSACLAHSGTKAWLCASPLTDCRSLPFPSSPSHQPPQKVDVWGAGIVLYALLYGQLPFEPSRPDIFAEHDERRRPPPPGRQVWLGVGTQIVCVCVCVCVCARPAVAGGRCMQGGGVLGLPAGVAHRWHQQTVRQATFH